MMTLVVTSPFPNAHIGGFGPFFSNDVEFPALSNNQEESKQDSCSYVCMEAKITMEAARVRGECSAQNARFTAIVDTSKTKVYHQNNSTNLATDGSIQINNGATLENLDSTKKLNTYELVCTSTSTKRSTHIPTTPPAVRPKVIKNQQVTEKKIRSSGKSNGDCLDKTPKGQKCLQNIKPPFFDRKDKREKREKRNEKNKKWKPLPVSSLGFFENKLDHQMYLLQCEDENNYNTDNDDTENENLVGPDHQTETFSESEISHPNETEEFSTDICTGGPKDDVTFFKCLGIDIHADDYDDDVFDDYSFLLGWDGLSFEVSSKGKGNGCFPAQSNIANTSKTARGRRQQTKPNTETNKKTKDTFSENFKIYKSSKYEWTEIPQLANISNYVKLQLFELECSSSKRIRIRADRDRNIEKGHKAVKSKNVLSLFPKTRKKRLYMHHRLVKRNNLQFNFRDHPWHADITPMSKWNVTTKSSSAVSNARTQRSERPAPVQNLKHALHETNAPGSLESELASFLMSLQHRDMTPEDYDMLLRLDDSVKPKTVSQNVIDKLKTEVVGPEGLDVMCVICMEPYIAGQERKFLPCEHDFHRSCIENWLQNSSMNCPLDGLPIEQF